MLPAWFEVPRWAVEAGFFAYLVSGIGYVILERRHPRTTLVWVLALVLMPVLGLLLYFAFGRRPHRRHLRRGRARIHATALAEAQRLRPDRLPAELDKTQRGLVRLALYSGPTPLRRAHDVRLIRADARAHELILERIEASRKNIHLEFYIWRDDEAGRSVSEALTRRARAGVEVRVLYDHLGSLGLPSSHFAALIEAGGEVRAFATIFAPSFRSARANFRNHRKIALFDGEIGMLGGANIANEYLGIGAKADTWEDMVVRMQGPAVRELEVVFASDWIDAGGKLDAEGDGLVSVDAQYDPWAGEGPFVQIIPSGPDARVAGSISAQFSTAVAQAFDRCWIATPYLIPDDSLRVALTSAARMGVDVRLLVPAKGDHFWVRWASLSYYDELLSAGCRIFESPQMIHSKYLLVDDNIAAVGSANMDIRSFHLNYEITAMFYDAGVNAALADWFERDAKQSAVVTLEERGQLGSMARSLEALARVSSPLL
jgi:cardiolipin synthase